MNDQFDGDVKLYPTDDGGDINFYTGQPDMDGGLETAAYISLFTSDWWGNAVSSDAEKTGSKMETLFRRVLNNQTRLDAIELAKQALAWMITDGVASEITVDAAIPQPNILDLSIRIVDPAGNVQSLKYALNWQAQRVARSFE